MSVISYLLNHKTKQVFELGKVVSGYDLFPLTTKEALEANILYQLNNGYIAECINKEKWAKDIAEDIAATIGLSSDVDAISDMYDHIYTKFYGDYILVGTVYTDKSDIGKPFLS